MFKKLFNRKEKSETPVEQYMVYLDRLTGQEPEFYGNPSNTSALPGVTSIVYRDFSEKDLLTGFTYGLSLVEHRDWKQGRPELTITVDSKQLSWGQAIGFIANRLRGDCPFSYSNTINFGMPISTDSDMDAFLVFAPSIFKNKVDYLNLDIGLEYKLNIVGIYPIYAEEMKHIEEWGLECFWKHPNFNLYDVNRPRIR